MIYFLLKINKLIIDILKDLLVLDADPNPLAQGLAKNAKELIEGMLDKFEVSKMSI